MFKDNIKIRPLKKSDSSDEIVRLFGQLTSREVKFDINEVLQVPNLFCYVAEVDGKIAGFASLTLRFVPTKGYVGVVEDVVVDKNYRRMGLGTKLMEKLIACGEELELFAVELTSEPKREGARRLYQRLGFKLLETGVFRYGFKSVK